MDSKICIICKGEYVINKNNPLTREHIIPEFIGGGLIAKNVCKKCNGYMGSGFEGDLANSFIFKLPRFVHNISGKQDCVKNPLSGVYDSQDIGRFKLEDNGNLTLIPEIKIERDGDGFKVGMKIDKSELANCKLLLKKKLIRYFPNPDMEKLKQARSLGV